MHYLRYFVVHLFGAKINVTSGGSPDSTAPRQKEGSLPADGEPESTNFPATMDSFPYLGSPTKISGLVFSSNWRENSTNAIHPGYAPAFIWSKEWTNPLLMRFSDAELKSMFSYRDALKKPSAPPSAALPFTSGASAAAERPQTGQRIFH